MIYKDDHEQRFLLMYQRYIDEVYQFVFFRTGFKKTTAEDITQDIFIDVFRGLSGFKGLCSERTWILKITKNKVNDFYRKQYSHPFEIVDIDTQLQELLDDPAQDILEKIVKEYENEIIHLTLNNLPQQYKIVLSLKYLDEKSIKEIAFLIEKSPKAVESLLQRAKCEFIKKYRECNQKEVL